MGLFNGGIFKSINKGLTKAWDINVKGTKLIGSALFPGAGNYLSQQETNAANLKMQQQANAQNLALWNAQNAYNTPAEQMKRLEAAGLNPNLAYGQIADSKAGSAPTMESTHFEAPKNTGQGALEALATYQQVVNGQEQNKSIRIQNALSAEELRYKRHEVNTLIKSRALRNDLPIIKAGDRVISGIKDRVVNPVGNAIGKSSLWGGILDFVSNASQKLTEHNARIQAKIRAKRNKGYEKN